MTWNVGGHVERRHGKYPSKARRVPIRHRGTRVYICISTPRYLILVCQKPLDHRRLDITEKVRPMSSRPHPNASPSFWSDTFKAHVDGEIKVVKLYYKSSGGRSTFKEHLEVLSRNP